MGEEQDRLTLEEIDKLAEIWEGFSLMDKHGVPKENCLSIQDMKERLRLHHLRDIGEGRSPEAAQEVITLLRREDEEKRKELKDIFQECTGSLKSLDEQVTAHLEAEGTISNVGEDLEKHIRSLQTSECPILVAGETSSGKSSLLNLLLGQEILPQSLLSCTSVICKLRYGETLHARIHSGDGSVEERALDPDSNPVEQLSKYIYREGDREQEDWPYTEVEIFLPLDLLKTGVYIIDSPGFGENPAMDNVFLDYITSNEIFAFIYVIKSDNAGGVQEDRLQRILKHIVDRQKTGGIGSFDPRAAIFVCNRWDLVPENEHEAVIKDSFKKLSRCWPDLTESQVFQLSTTKAWLNRQVGYISEDFSKLLDGIQRLIPVGLQRKIHHSYRWLEHCLIRVLHHVSSYLARTRISAKELHYRHNATELRLHKVEREADVIMKALDKKLDKCIRKVAQQLSDFMKSDEAIWRMSDWMLDQLPCVQEDDLWVDVESELDCAIERRLAEVLREWDEQNKLFLQVQVELFNAFRDEFLVLESQLNSIEACLQSDDVSLSEKSDEDATKYLSLTQNIDTSDSVFDLNLNTLQKIVLGFAAPVLVPVAVGILVGAPIFLLWDFKKWRRRSLAQKNLVNYTEDPRVFMITRSRTILEKVAQLDNVTDYVYSQMEPARMCLDQMRSAVPKLVDSNRKLMESIIQDKRTREEIEERYLSYETLIPRLQEKLATYGNVYIREYNFRHNAVKVIEKEGFIGKFQKQTTIWAEIKDGKLKTESGSEALVTVKRYRRQISSMHLVMEETHYRKTRHPQVAQFIGTFQASKGIPGFLLEPGLVRARQELFGFKAFPKKSKGGNVLMERCRQILEQVGIALEYLHYRGIIHMELSLDTVMLLPNKDLVKLTNLGEPRRADLPTDISEELAGDFIYLPPEVLRGEMYRQRGDMYSLGIMAWELWHQELAFKQQRKAPLADFIQSIKVTTLLEDQDNPFNGLIHASMSSQPDERLCSTTWVNEIRKLDLLQKGDTGEDEY